MDSLRLHGDNGANQVPLAMPAMVLADTPIAGTARYREKMIGHGFVGLN